MGCSGMNNASINQSTIFTPEEMSQIFTSKKRVGVGTQYKVCPLFTKIYIDYTDNVFKKTGELNAKEHVVYYVSSNFKGQITHSSSLAGLMGSDIRCSYCKIKEQNVEYNTNQNFKTDINLSSTYRDNEDYELVYFEFNYVFKQIEHFGIRILNINFDDNELIQGSISIKYDKRQYNVISADPNIENKNKSKIEGVFEVFNKKKFLLFLKQNSVKWSINFLDKKIADVINRTLDSAEKTLLNEALYSTYDLMKINPFDTNIIFYQVHHFITNGVDNVKGWMLLYQPIFTGKSLFFQKEEFIEPYFIIKNMSVNGEEAKRFNDVNSINIENNYYVSDKKTNYFKFSSENYFAFLELSMEASDISTKNNEYKYYLDPRLILGLKLHVGSHYRYIIETGKNTIAEFNLPDEAYPHKKEGNKYIFNGEYKIDRNKYDDEAYMEKHKDYPNIKKFQLEIKKDAWECEEFEKIVPHFIYSPKK